MEDFEIDNFLARDKAKEVLLKIEELEDVLIKIGVYDTSEISLDKLGEVLRESIIKFEKSKL
mgnify:CR=1 FL=1